MTSIAVWKVGALGLLVVLPASCMRMGYRGQDAAAADARLDGPRDRGPADLAPTVEPIQPLDRARAELPGDLATIDQHLVDLAPRPERALDLPVADSSQPDLQKADLPKPDLSPIPGVWMTVAKGSFTMGSPATEACNAPGETQHLVTLTHAFEIAATEVRQTDFAKLLGYNPSAFASCGASCPVDTASWHEAAAYCNALSALIGLATCYSCSGSGAGVSCAAAASYTGSAIYDCPGYRLPTEAEWEYAYRAGTTTGLYNGELTANCNGTDPKADLIAWYGTTSTHGVGLKQANAWGLFDMAGNVWEWTNDLFENNLGSVPVIDPVGAAAGTGRVYRGGSYFYGTKYLRAAYRAGFNPALRSNDLGFRCVRSK